MVKSLKGKEKNKYELKMKEIEVDSLKMYTKCFYLYLL